MLRCKRQTKTGHRSPDKRGDTRLSSIAFDSYRSASTNQLKPHLGAVPVPKLRTRAIQNVFNDLAKRLAPTYIRMVKTVLVQSLNFAIEQGDITINPAEKVRIPIVKHKPGRSLTPDEVRAVRTACAGHHYGLAIELALMGMRRAELPGLRWEDFNDQTGTLIIRRQIQRDRARRQWAPVDTKGDSDRVLSLGPKLTKALRHYRWQMADERDTKGWQSSGYIFVSARNGGVCPPGTIYKAFVAIACLEGILDRS
jgi:integrase